MPNGSISCSITLYHLEVHPEISATFARVAGTPHLLVVLAHAPRQAHVYHEAHVGPVDAHAEGTAGDHHVQPPLLPLPQRRQGLY